MRPIALITGGGRGIGAATARLAACRGYDLCINYAHDPTAAEAMAETCRSQGARVLTHRADIADPGAVAKMFETCDRTLGRIALLVNNAGIIGAASRVAELSDAALKQCFEVNVFGTIYCARAAVVRMSTAQGGPGGVIVNLSSIAAELGSPGEYVHYAASKGAVESFTVGLAKEVGAEGIRVNAVRAGTTETEIHARSGNPDRPRMVARSAPLGRVATPEDIAEAVLWLASEQAGYATGSILKIGGGL